MAPCSMGNLSAEFQVAGPPPGCLSCASCLSAAWGARAPICFLWSLLGFCVPEVRVRIQPLPLTGQWVRQVVHHPSPTGSPVCTGNEHFRKLNVRHCVLCSELHFLCASMDLGPIPVGKGLLFGSSCPPPGTLGFLRGHSTAAGTTAHMPTGSKPSKKRKPPGAAAVIH